MYYYYPVYQFSIGEIDMSVWILHDNKLLVQADTVYPKLLVFCYPFLTQEVNMVGEKYSSQLTSRIRESFESAKLESMHEARIIGRFVAIVRQLPQRHVFNGILNAALSQYLQCKSWKLFIVVSNSKKIKQDSKK